MPACLLFDLLGTLVEPHPKQPQTAPAEALAETLAETLAESRRMAPQLSAQEFCLTWQAAFARVEAAAATAGREFHLDEVSWLVCETFAGETAVSDPAPVLAAQLSKAVSADWISTVMPVPGAAGIVRRLAEHYRLGVICNSHYPPAVFQLLEAMALSDAIEVVVTSAEVGFPKPDRRIFEQALAELQLQPAQVVYVGNDFEHDYRGASELGMFCYLIGSHARVPRSRQLRSILDLAIHFSI